MAQLESASVAAFRRMRCELVAHGAPRRLLRGAERAARDEARHFRMMRRLARRRGVDVTPASQRIDPVRPLRAIAIENAIEGCVNETIGALVAHHQARFAKAQDVREVMRRIASDETRHATLAWQVARWLEFRLDWGSRAAVRDARDQAVMKLVLESGMAPFEHARQQLGLPSRASTLSLVRELGRRLWERY
jgi:hypothetical protein